MSPVSKKKNDAPAAANPISAATPSPDPPHLPLYVGTSGWAYTIWKPDFYPKEVSSKNFLRYYATQLTAVEEIGRAHV